MILSIPLILRILSILSGLISQVLENGTVATNLTYSGTMLSGISVMNGMASVRSSQFNYTGGSLTSVTQDNNPATAVTLAYTPWPSKDCNSQVMLGNASNANGPMTRINWGMLPSAGVAQSVYRTNAKGGVFRYDFSGNGDLVAVTTPILTGASSPTVYHFTWDGNHNMTGASDGTTSVSATYSNGIPTSVTSGGATWSATYAGPGGADLFSTLDPLGHGVSLVYADNNQPHVPTAITDELGLTWFAAHNVFGQLLSASAPAGSPTGTSSIAYDEFAGSPTLGYPLTAADGNGDVVTFDSYDALGDLTALSTYPVHGNANIKNTTGFLYDTAQRLIRVTNPDGTNSQAVYSGNNLAYTLDEKGTRYDYAYCAACGLLTSITGPMGWGLNWTYDGDKDLTTFTDARYKVTRYSYGPARMRWGSGVTSEFACTDSPVRTPLE